MAGADYFIRQGDTASPLTATLLDAAGAAVDIEGADVTLQLLPLGGISYLLDSVASNDQVDDGSDGSRGNVSYAWQVGDTDDSGYLLGTWVVDFGADIQSYPNGGYFLVYVFPDIANTETSFATSADLEARLGLEFTAAEHIRATRLMEIATALIRRESGQTISFVEDDTLSWTGRGATRLILPERPVVSVGQISVDGEIAEATSYYLSGNEVVRQPAGSPFWSLSAFWNPVQDLEVVYTHGFEDIPGDIVAICLEMVARVWVNPGAVVSSTVGSVATTYSVMPVAGMLMTEEERKLLARTLQQAIGTVVLR